MLSMKEICEKTGLTVHTFQTWRRNNANLLPKPIAVDKRVIYFDDSILERIKFIREQQGLGKTLAQIEKMVEAQAAEEALPSWEVRQADHEDLQDEIKVLREKWESGQVQAEVCAALRLDPALSGLPATFCLPAVGKPEGGLMVYVSIISNGVIHFVELYVDLYEETEVKNTAEMPAQDFGMLLYIIGQEFADRRKLLKVEMIPYLLFQGLKGTGADSRFWLESIETAQIMNQITEASRQYLIRLKKDEKLLESWPVV